MYAAFADKRRATVLLRKYKKKEIMPKNRFLENMESYGIGDVVSRMSNFQQEVIKAVEETGLAGKLTLVLTFKRNGSKGITVGAKVTPVIPQSSIRDVDMHRSENSQLYEEDPDQITYENVHKIPSEKKANQL